MSDETVKAWSDGYITDQEALRRLCSDLGEIESEIEPLEAERKALRSTIEHIVTRLNGKATVPGYGSLAITNGGTRVSWDGKALDSLVAKLARNGFAAIAEELAQARRETTTAASLRITREK